MTRRLVSIALVLLATSPVMAIETIVSDEDAGIVGSGWNAEVVTSQFVTDDDSSASKSKTHWITPVEDDPVFRLMSSRSDDRGNGCECEGSSEENGTCFYPLCDHGCLTECMDCWCVCDCEESCCTTDEWCLHPCQCSHGNNYLDESGNWHSNDLWCDVWGEPKTVYDTGVRLGVWGVTNDGSPTKTGEFQDLETSPFWDIDLVTSDGEQTLDLILSGLDNEANDARFYYYGHGLTAKGRLGRFLRRYDHDPLTDDNQDVVTDDLNVGEDYAIRVQQLDTRFQGRINDNLKWRLNVWGQRKFGERQANAAAHCFDVDPSPATNRVCHVLSQRQAIDWLTMEIQPVLEARIGDATVEYSRTMRALEQDDQAVFRTYSTFAPFSTGQPFPYAFVPENFTQIDRLKLSWQVTEADQIYANMYLGETENEFRKTHRDFDGYDLRWTNHSMDPLTVTTYTSRYDEDNQFPPFLLPEESTGLAVQARHPVDHTRTRAGIKGNWFPNGYSDKDMIWVGGYEYLIHEREFANYAAREILPGPVLVPVLYTQPDTKIHQIEVGPDRRWSETVTTFGRYRVRFIEDPITGFREANLSLNTNQEELEHRVEIGGTWMPAANFMTTAQVSVVSRRNRSTDTNFDEDNFPFMFTAWYAPSDRLSLAGAYGYFTNWIDQDITLGVYPPFTETTRWDYAGENHLISLNATYAWTSALTLLGGLEWDHGTNVFDIPPSTAAVPADWSALAGIFDVDVTTIRWTAGADWQAYRDVYVFGRYIFFDYQDDAGNPVSGTTHMALSGLSWFR